MGVIYLVRHGKALDGLPSPDAEKMEDSYDHLSDLGHRQASAAGRALAQRLAPGAKPAVIAGPLRRQQDTAQRIAEQIGGAEVRTDVGWKEYDSGAVVAPYLEANRERAEKLLTLEPDARDRLLGRLVGEAMQEWVQTSGYEEFREQVRGGLARAREQGEAADGCAIVVTSGGPIALAACDSLGLPRELWPKLAGRILTASVTVLSYSNRGAEIVNAGTGGGDGAGAGAGAGAGGGDGTGAGVAAGLGADVSAGRGTAEAPPTLLSFNEHAHLDVPDADGSRPLRRFR